MPPSRSGPSVDRPAKLEVKPAVINTLYGVETRYNWWVTIDRRRPYSNKLAYESVEAAKLGASTWLHQNFPQYTLTEE